MSFLCSARYHRPQVTSTMRCTLLVTLVLSATPAAQSGDLAARTQAHEAIRPLERAAVAARPADVEGRRRLAAAYAAVGRRIDAASELRMVTELAPGLAGVWYELGQAYNAIKQDALITFDEHPEDASWRQLLAADALLARSKWIDAFALYRASIERLPSMVSIHDSHSRGSTSGRAIRIGPRESVPTGLSQPPTAPRARRSANFAPAGMIRRSAPRRQSPIRSRGTGRRAHRPSSPSPRSNISTSSPTRPNGERCAPRWRAQRNATTTLSWSSKLR